MGHTDRRLCEHPLLQARPDQRQQRQQAAGIVDVLDRRAARPRGRASRDRRHDVRAHALPQHRLRPRPQQGRQDPLEIRAQAGSERHSGDVLRHGQSRPRLCATARSSCIRPTPRIVALDAKTGKVDWSVVNGDPKKGETNTATVMPVKDKLIVGISGGEFGVRCHVTAYDIKTGKLVWRAYSKGRTTRSWSTRRRRPSSASRSARIRASRPGRATNGRPAAAAPGAGTPTIPKHEPRSTTAPAIPRPGIRSSGRATTSGR